jgi:oxygen-independent coproporphyrinogen III oxidase
MSAATLPRPEGQPGQRYLPGISRGASSGRVRHLYVHLPFCGHRCGYCDFVTAVGRKWGHAGYVDALLAELELERDCLAPELETVFLGGGTPTYTEPGALERLLRSLPSAEEITVEANPETVTPALARLLRDRGVTRISLGAQTFHPHLLAVLERRATPDVVRRAFYHLRDAYFDNISLDLIYGIPGQTAAALAADLDEAVGLAPDHISCYELEAKPGTRFTHAWGAELARQAEAMEGYLELVVNALEAAGYRWYETSSFCREAAVARGGEDVGAHAEGRDRRARHNLAYWRGRDYLGLGIGAVSTVGALRWQNRAGLGAYLAELRAGRRPPREVEALDADTKRRERLMLGLRLDEPLVLAGVADVVDMAGLDRLERLGLAEHREDALRLTARGRRLGGAATVELLREIPANSAIATG